MNLLGLFVLVVFALGCAMGWFWFVERPLKQQTPPPQPIPEPPSIKEILDAISRPAVVKPRYVCGFAFHGGGTVRSKVVLIRKVKPEWQKGKLNGVGGKIERGETPPEAMCREFHEETGIHISVNEWEVYAVMDFPKAEVIFLRCFNQDAAKAKTQTCFSSELIQPIREQIEHRAVRGIDEIPEDKIIPNLRWAIPMAFNAEWTRNLVKVKYEDHN